MDKFQAMQTFCTVVDEDSFVNAAELLLTSKAAVSRHVSQLEEKLGVRLLQRTTRQLSLTEEGRLFYDRSRDLLASLKEAEDELSQHTAVARGRLRINAPVSFGLSHLAPLWGEFIARHPQIELDITLSDRLVDLVEEAYDLAIRIAQLPNSTLISRRLTTTKVTLCAAPAYLKQRGTPMHPCELARHDTIAYSYWSGGDDWYFEGPEGRVTVRTRPRARSNSGETCVALALAGHGIALQPDFLINQYLASGQLVALLPAYPSLELGVYAIYPSRKFPTPRLRAMVDFLIFKLG
ncbi:LysR family transcriptional regulator [Pseudohongiella spirulinae]|uniref:Transcriptional regulator, LysR family n=1 Tax=Pseudohongiella spirulinae TaxID=1249552 RepID=A0A0S2KGT2_9GAMM|nr:LysR family transcriptional regulator [Pseudohongiella spirulinae]ALO47170.1 Transcriptional regulator, LysR family [Pseudohongiella spirulinae]